MSETLSLSIFTIEADSKPLVGSFARDTPSGGLFVCVGCEID
jgi:hypothetical protein